MGAMSTAERHLARYLDLSNRVWIVPGALAYALSVLLAFDRGLDEEAMGLQLPVTLIFSAGLGLWRFYHRAAFNELAPNVRAWGWLASYVFNGSGLMLGLLALDGPQVLWVYAVFLIPTAVSAWGLACAVTQEETESGALSFVRISG